MEHKGFKYQPWEDREEDNCKIFHDVLTPTGKTISMPLSPYVTPTQKHFEKLVEIGCPTESKVIKNGNRTVVTCWQLEDIDQAYSRKF
jgi:hypothetical protein